jgi:hypothetical protein
VLQAMNLDSTVGKKKEHLAHDVKIFRVKYVSFKMQRL